MLLYTGKRAHPYIWEELTIDDGEIQRVEQLEELEKQPILVDSNPFFEWAPGVEIVEESAEDIVDENYVDVVQEIAQENDENMV